MSEINCDVCREELCAGGHHRKVGTDCLGVILKGLPIIKGVISGEKPDMSTVEFADMQMALARITELVRDL